MELPGALRELWRLQVLLRGTRPPVWRSRGEVAWALARSESALLGDRIGAAQGDGLGWREALVPPSAVAVAWSGSTASGRGLTWWALPSLCRGEAL